jgi:hypothetical protein
METFFYIGVVKRPFSQKMQNMTGKLYFLNGCVLTIVVA